MTKPFKQLVWKTKGSTHSAGYIVIYMPSHPFAHSEGKVYEHRLIMENHLGRYLLPEERMHHINGIKDDNRIENLKLFSNHSEHMKIESQNASPKTIESRFKQGKPPVKHKPDCVCFRCLPQVSGKPFQKGNPPPPHKEGCKCFRCSKNRNILKTKDLLTNPVSINRSKHIPI